MFDRLQKFYVFPAGYGYRRYHTIFRSRCCFLSEITRFLVYRVFHEWDNVILNGVSFFSPGFVGLESRFRFDGEHVRRYDRAILLPSESLQEPDVYYAREYHLGCQPKNTAET